MRGALRPASRRLFSLSWFIGGVWGGSGVHDRQTLSLAQFPESLTPMNDLISLRIRLAELGGSRDDLIQEMGFPDGAVVKNLPANSGDAGDAGLIPASGRSPWSRNWQPAPVFLPGKFHGQRSLVGYSLWGRKESDTAEHTNINKWENRPRGAWASPR